MTVQTKSQPARSKQIVMAKHSAPSHKEIAEAAYYLAEKRGFTPGHETEDWFQAERQLHKHPGHAL